MTKPRAVPPSHHGSIANEPRRLKWPGDADAAAAGADVDDGDDDGDDDGSIKITERGGSISLGDKIPEGGAQDP